MVAALAALAGLLAGGAAAGTIGFLLGRRTGSRRLQGLESELARYETAVARRYRDRLAQVRRRLGVLYVDGLPISADRELSELFEEGVRLAGQGAWERAHGRWVEAGRRARGAQSAALSWLCGACRFIAGRDGARADFAAALKAATEAGDRAGEAYSRVALARIDAQEKRAEDARAGLESALRMAGSLHDPELESTALVLLAGVVTSAGDRQEALELRRRAVRALEQAGDRGEAAAQYGAIGDLLLEQGDINGARAAHEDGMHIARQVRDRVGEAERLASVGRILRLQGERERAVELLERAGQLFDELSFPRGQARALYELGLAHAATGGKDAAAEFHERSLTLARRVEDGWLVARNLERLGAGCAEHRAFDKALELFEEAARLDREAGRNVELGQVLAGRGRVELAMGHHEAARELIGQALAMARAAGDQRAEATYLADEARVLRAAGDAAGALVATGRARELMKGRADALAVDLLRESALAGVAAGETSRAQADFRAALEMLLKAGDRAGAARLHLDQGRALQAAGKADDALRVFEDGLKLAHDIDDRVAGAPLLLAIAGVNRELRSYRQAAENAERAARLYRALGDEQGLGECELVCGRSLADEGDAEGARARFEQALRLFARSDSRRLVDVTNALMAALPRSETGVVRVDGDAPSG